MTEAASNIGETLSETLGQVGVLCRTAGKKVHDARCGTADALNGSASTVRDTAEAIDELAESTATKLDSTAAFVRNYNPADVFVTLGKVIGRHAAIFLTGAAAAGFVLGFAARSRFSASQRNASVGPICRDT
jgi:hypothetical protein